MQLNMQRKNYCGCLIMNNKKTYLTLSNRKIIVLISQIVFLSLVALVNYFGIIYVGWYVAMLFDVVVIGLNCLIYFGNQLIGLEYRKIIVDFDNKTITATPDFKLSKTKIQKRINVNILDIEKVVLAQTYSDSEGRTLEDFYKIRGRGGRLVMLRKICFTAIYLYSDKGFYKIITDYMKNEKIIEIIKDLKAINPSIVFERDFKQLRKL